MRKTLAFVLDWLTAILDRIPPTAPSPAEWPSWTDERWTIAEVDPIGSDDCPQCSHPQKPRCLRCNDTVEAYPEYCEACLFVRSLNNR